MNSKFQALALAGSAILAMGLGATSAQAAPATAQATAKAKILKQVTIAQEGTGLDFGTIVPGTAESTVVISDSGTRTCGTGLTCTGTVGASRFKVTGSNNTVVKITVPATVTLATSTTAGAPNMVATLSGAPGTINLGNSGATGSTFGLNASLKVAGNQDEGDYTGTYSVTADYQ